MKPIFSVVILLLATSRVSVTDSSSEDHDSAALDDSLFQEFSDDYLTVRVEDDQKINTTTSEKTPTTTIDINTTLPEVNTTRVPLALNNSGVQYEDAADEQLFLEYSKPEIGDLPLLNRMVTRARRVSILEHPYIASVRRNYSHYVTGSLITKNFVLTVAQAVYKVPVYELGVVLGENYNERGTMLRTVLLCIVHPKFRPSRRGLTHDLAVLRFYEDVAIYYDRVNIKIIPIAMDNRYGRTKQAFVTGWGRCDWTGRELCLPRGSVYYPGERLDPMLRTATFVDVEGLAGENTYCSYYAKQGLKLHEGMMCLGVARSKDSTVQCLGVPGAALVMGGRLAGVLSWGCGCGYDEDMPLIYTNLTYYWPWIKQVVSEVFYKVRMENSYGMYAATKGFQTVQQYRASFANDSVLPKSRRTMGVDELQMNPVDVVLANVDAKVYDIRDFIDDKRYAGVKRSMYRDIKKRSTEALVPLKEHSNRPRVEPPAGGGGLLEVRGWTELDDYYYQDSFNDYHEYHDDV